MATTFVEEYRKINGKTMKRDELDKAPEISIRNGMAEFHSNRDEGCVKCMVSGSELEKLVIFKKILKIF